MLLVVGEGRAVAAVLARSNFTARFAVRRIRGPGELTGARHHERPRVIVADLEALDARGLGTIRQLKQSWPRVPLLVVVPRAGDREILQALREGATGCLFREDLDRRLDAAVHEAMDGGAPMSSAVTRLVLARACRESNQMKAVQPQAAASPRLGSRKLQILDLLARGRSYDEIAAALGISCNTVRFHVRETYATLGVNTKVEAVMAAIERGLIKR